MIKIWPCCGHGGGNWTCIATTNWTFGYHHFNMSYLINHFKQVLLFQRACEARIFVLYFIITYSLKLTFL